MPTSDQSYDYIIVGAGAAGCVLAYRLSLDPAIKVLLVEAGPEDRNPLIHFPRGLVKLMADPRHCWQMPTTVSDRNVSEIWLRGKMLGGSSSINGMIYVRAQPEDYADWAAAGVTGWEWDVMSEAYRAIENHELGADDVRGTGGPLNVSVTKPNPVCDALVASAAAMGLPARQDVNRPSQKGVGYSARTVWKGLRVSAAKAFLKPVRKRPNLTVVTDTLTRRVLFDATRAVGIECVSGGHDIVYHCRGEVILSAGAIHSPAILQRSGIGASRLLSTHGIPVVINSPRVGENMREHRSIQFQFRLRENRGYNRWMRGPGLLFSALQYVLLRKGPLAQAAFDVVGFFSTEGKERPDAQFLATPMTLDQSERLPVVEKDGGLLIIAYPARPTSQGSVAITGAGETAPLDIRGSFMANPEDRKVMGGIATFLREMSRKEPLASLISHETHPGPAIEGEDAIVRAASDGGYCGYHAVGTCAMGPDEGDVLDNRLCVRGAEQLRVIDNSAMPQMVSGNTNAPVMALAWRAADLLLADRAAQKAGGRV